MLNQVSTYLQKTETEQLLLLQELVLQSSHTLDKEGVDKVGAIITRTLANCNLSFSRDMVAERGDNLIFRSAACRGNLPHILLLGHMDTVFLKDNPFKTFRTDDIKAYGPGVIDMKGGLVTAIYLLKCLQHLDVLDHIPIVFICNSDEEMGSSCSAALIRAETRKSLCALVFECGGRNGEVVTGRKGRLGYRLDIFGKAGHAAFAHRNGKASAILELAHTIIAIEKLNNPERQIVVNAGHIVGGTAANVVAEKASVDIDIRYVGNEDGIQCRADMEKIAAQRTVPGTRSVLSLTGNRPPMESSPGNLALYQLVKKQADCLGMKIEAERRSGVSDANIIAECGIPVLDGLGPVGDLDHSENEYMVKDSLVQRCRLSTLSVMAIWQHYQKGAFSF